MLPTCAATGEGEEGGAFAEAARRPRERARAPNLVVKLAGRLLLAHSHGAQHLPEGAVRVEGRAPAQQQVVVGRHDGPQRNVTQQAQTPQHGIRHGRRQLHLQVQQLLRSHPPTHAGVTRGTTTPPPPLAPSDLTSNRATPSRSLSVCAARSNESAVARSISCRM
jgi:hypothetical protein